MFADVKLLEYQFSKEMEGIMLSSLSNNDNDLPVKVCNVPSSREEAMGPIDIQCPELTKI